MSTVTNKAAPKAAAGQEQNNGSSFLFDGAQRLAGVARANPKTAAAVGAGVVAATAAATVALARRGPASGRSRTKGRSSRS